MGRGHGCLASGAPPCLTACCAAFLALEDWLCPSPCPPPAHRERQDTRSSRTYLPWAHGDRQRVCLSHLCCWNGVWRRKEKPFVLQCAPVHPCCLLVGLGEGSVPTAHRACLKAAALLLGTSHASCSETLLPATGWGGGQSWGLWDTSKAGCSLLTAAMPLPSSQPWHGACLPAGAQCPAPPSLFPRPGHR